MSDKNSLLVEEQALHEQEQGIVEMEAQLHAQEQGVAQMERAFQKKNKSLLNLASYVRDQETSLIGRARAMGDKAVKLVTDQLAKSDSQVGPIDLDLGRAADRQSLLQKRRELLSQRMSLIEEREALYAARAENLERAEGQVTELEQKLVRRETAVSEAARAVFSSSSSLLDEDDEEGDPAPYVRPSPSVGTSSVKTVVASAPRPIERDPMAIFTPATTRIEPRKDAAGSELAEVESGEVEREDEDGLSGVSRAEDKATRKRASARARVRTNQFKITLEAHLDPTEPHHLFRYENDSADDLPGLFIATPNLLKVGREVRIRVGRAGQYLEATGIVAWRRQRGDVGGVPGMGIELLNLSEPEKALIGKWIKEKAPETI